jgi:hypothetical protein
MARPVAEPARTYAPGHLHYKQPWYKVYLQYEQLTKELVDMPQAKAPVAWGLSPSLGMTIGCKLGQRIGRD